MGMKIADNASTGGAHRNFSQWDDNAAEAPKLEFTYTVGAAFIPYPYPRGLRGGHSVQSGGLI